MKCVKVSDLSKELGVNFGTSGIRGRVVDLTPALCFVFVKSFLQEICPKTQKVAVGLDLRPSSSYIVKACLLAIDEAGASAVFCGAIPTPALAFYAMQNSMPAVMITGSHIPFDRNGIKFYRPDGEISKADELSIMESSVEFSETIEDDTANFTLPTINSSAIEYFEQRYIKLFPSGMLSGKRIGVYEHSSVARDLIKSLLSHYGAEIISLDRTDTFIPIDTEAVSSEDVQKGLNWSTKYQLDGIISTDGDGDRPLIANEKGEWLRGDILGVLCANYLNASHVVAPVNVNSVLELEGKKLQPSRVSLRTKIGSPYVIEGMRGFISIDPKLKVVGYEANGGFLVGSDIEINNQILKALPTRDSILPALIVFAMSYEKNKPISHLSKNFAERYTESARIKDIPTDVSRQIINNLKIDKYKQSLLLGSINKQNEKLKIVSFDETDGLRMTVSNGDVLHLRSSGNAPELRLYLETSYETKAIDNIFNVVEEMYGL